MLQWTFGCRYLTELWFSLNIWPEIVSEGHMIALFLFFFKGLACCFDPDWSLLWKLVWGRASAHWSGSQSIRCPGHAYSSLKRELISISLYFSDKFPNVYDVLVWAVTQTLCNSTWKASSNLWNHPSLSYSSKSESSFILHRKSYLHSPGNSDHSFFSPLILHLDLHILALKFSLVCS